MWATLFGAGVAYEVHELRGDPLEAAPLSEVVRWASRVETPLGRAVFLIGWGAFAAWFANHIVGPRSDPRYSAWKAGQ